MFVLFDALLANRQVDRIFEKLGRYYYVLPKAYQMRHPPSCHNVWCKSLYMAIVHGLMDRTNF